MSDETEADDGPYAPDPLDLARAAEVVTRAVFRLCRAGVMPELTRGEPLSTRSQREINLAVQAGAKAAAYLFDLIGPPAGDDD